MLPFSDYIILQEIQRLRPDLLEQMAQTADAMGGPPPGPGTPAGPDPSQNPPPKDKEDEEDDDELEGDDEETDPSEEEEDTDENDDRKTDLRMIHNCIKQVKTAELKNILRQFLDKLKKATPSKPAAQMDQPPATEVPEDQNQEPPQQPPGAMPGGGQQGPMPAQGGGGM
jgi:hypothetical protein